MSKQLECTLSVLFHEIQMLVDDLKLKILLTTVILGLLKQNSKGDEIYQMNEETPGYVLIIHNKDFDDRDHKRRDGTDKDANRLVNLFSKREFNVIVKKNLSAKVCTFAF